MPKSSTVWWAPVSRSPLASTFKPRRPCRASRSSMWSRKPTPVAALASPPSRSSESRICVSAVSRCLSAVLVILRPNHRRLAVDGEALRPRDRVDLRCQLRRRLGGDLHGCDLAAENSRAEGARETARAGGRKDVIRARDVIAKGGRAVVAGKDATGGGDAPGVV